MTGVGSQVTTLKVGDMLNLTASYAGVTRALAMSGTRPRGDLESMDLTVTALDRVVRSFLG